MTGTVAKPMPYIEWARRLDRLGIAFVLLVAMAASSLFVRQPWSSLLAIGAAAGMLLVLQGQYARRKIFAASQLSHGLLSIAEDCIKLLDLDGRIVCVSEVGRTLIEAKCADDLLGLDWLGLWKGPDARAAFERARTGQSTSFSGACRTFGGALKWWTSSFAPVYGEDGRVSGVLCKSRDITAEVNLIDELRGSARVQKDMEDHVDAVFWTASADFRELLHVSSAFERMWEMPTAALREDKTAWMQRVHPEDMPELRAKMRGAVDPGVPQQSYFRLMLGDARLRWVRADIYPVIEQGAVSRVVSVCVDATEERMRLQELHTLANIDSLTGLHNRNAMTEALVARCAMGEPLAYVFIDIDRI
jgi:PAS domain-containing protein